MPLVTPLTSPGVSSGIDTESLITKLIAAQARPLNNLQEKQITLQNEQSAYSTLATKLVSLQLDASNLSLTSTYSGKTATPSNSTVLSASAGSAAASASYNVTVLQNSTPTRLYGATGISNGSLNINSLINTSGLNTTVAGGTDPNKGSFTVNGTSISYDLSHDTLNGVLSRINASSAGVTALYDKFTDRVVLTNATGGAGSITVSDVDGNLASALKLQAGDGATSVAGQVAKVTIDGLNNGNPISSNNGIFTSNETGISGLTFNVLASSGTSTITVGNDTSSAQSAITGFISSYNSVMDFITQQSAVSGSGSSIQPGLFTSDLAVQTLKNDLRGMLGSAVPGLPNGFGSLGQVGVGTTGTNPDISITDSTRLTNSMNTNLTAFTSLMTDPTNGVMTKLNKYLATQNSNANGFVQSKQTIVSSQLAQVADDITTQKTFLFNYETKLRTSFTAMEQAISGAQSGIGTMISNLPSISKN